MIITIQGNIGSGKSSFVSMLKQQYQNNPHFLFVDEPVNTWLQITDHEGDNILSKFYKDKTKYAFSFQMVAYITRLSKLREAIRSKTPIIITERDLLCDRHVFAQMLYDDGDIEPIEFEIYKKWFDEFAEEVQTTHHIYIQTSTKTAYERVNKRSRTEEVGQIPFEYLDRCCQYHNQWLLSLENTLILDGEPNKTNIEDYNSWFMQFEKLARQYLAKEEYKTIFNNSKFRRNLSFEDIKDISHC
jgi:deoxyadenosine/deoxycytidine kinase